MPSRFLKTHYRRGASVLTPEQIEEIRCLKNRVPAYRNYHINKDRVSDIWDDCERLQQSGEYVLADMLPEPSNHDDIVHFKNNPLGLPNISSENYGECDIVFDSKKKDWRKAKKNDRCSILSFSDVYMFEADIFIPSAVTIHYLLNRPWTPVQGFFIVILPKYIACLTNPFRFLTFSRLV